MSDPAATPVPTQPAAGRLSVPVSIPAALAQIHEQWQPHRLVSVNDQDVKIARIGGEFIWHAHPDSDELFVVISGELTIALRDAPGPNGESMQRDVALRSLETFVVPRGVEHRPSTPEGVETVIVMVEKQGTVNTGDAGGDRTSELRELG
jgi:mannose-6-phosphate isomerase-like protein (cupin superfamily)